MASSFQSPSLLAPNFSTTTNNQISNNINMATPNNTSVTTAAGIFKKGLEEFWTSSLSSSSSSINTTNVSTTTSSDGDFRPLQSAGSVVVKCLRSDEEEMDADLYKRISATNSTSHYYYYYNSHDKIFDRTIGTPRRTGESNPISSSSSRNYTQQQQFGQATPVNTNSANRQSFVSPPNTGKSINSTVGGNSASTMQQQPTQSTTSPPPIVTLQHIQSVPLPPFLVQRQKLVQMSSFMGLLAPAKLAYMTIDSTLYLWSIGSLVNGVASSTTSQQIYQDSSALCSFAVPSKECIVTVGLVKPKYGVFRKESVKWCLVVVTTTEVILCALVFGTNGSNNQDTGLRLIPTRYSMPTDKVRMTSIIGTESGRIMLGGDDGCLYEMSYDANNMTNVGSISSVTISVDEVLDNFYDKDDILVPENLVITPDNMLCDPTKTVAMATLTSVTDRAWETIASTTGLLSDTTNVVVDGTIDNSKRRRRGSEQYNEPSRKCRKINRTSTASASSILGSVVPDFITRGVLSLFGSKVPTGGGKIIQMVVDEHRQCLYTLSSTGYICSFDLRSENSQVIPPTAKTSYESIMIQRKQQQTSSAVRIAAATDVVRLTRLYLETVQRGQMPPSRPMNGGGIVFPGGSLAAQANAGDKDGVRILLKLDKEATMLSSNTNTTRNGPSASTPQSSSIHSNILQPVSIHIIPPSESSRLTLLAVTSGGIRLYFSSLLPQVIQHGPSAFAGRGISTGRYSGNFSSSVNNNYDTLAPCQQLTLCNVRAPPPTTSSSLLSMPSSLNSTMATESPFVVSSSFEAKVVGAIPPNVVGQTSSSSRGRGSTIRSHNGSQQESPLCIDACTYSHGLFVAAIRAGNNEVHNNNTAATSNVIMSLCPDTMRRKSCGTLVDGITVNVENGGGDKVSENLIVPGGISETVSFPVHAKIYDQSGTGATLNGTNNTDGISPPMTPSCTTPLPGGVILDIAIIPNNNDEYSIDSKISNLTYRSRTPADSQLSLGTAPRYLPSNIVTRNSIVNTAAPESVKPTASSRSHEIVPFSSVQQQQDQLRNYSSFKILRSLFTNILLSRPLSYGLTSSTSSSDTTGTTAQHRSLMKAYRISTRDASKGFSRTALERPYSAINNDNSNSKGMNLMSGTVRPARLRDTLLRPEPIPLREMSTQYYGNNSTKDVVMINAGGIHYFRYETLASMLANTLSIANENAKNDSTTTSYFDGYTYQEGCALCIGLAINCGSEQLSIRAMEAALARAFVPKLLPSQSPGNSVFASAKTLGYITSFVDPLVPTSYEFHPSAINDALHMLFSRLVRPFWHKPVVVITEGRTTRVQWTDTMTTTPAKVELLFNNATIIDSITTPLRNLLNRMKTVFRRAINIVPGSSANANKSESMDIDDENDPLITRSLLQQSVAQRSLLLQQAGAIPSQHLTDAEAETIARRIEEKYIHCLFRLLARTVQLLDLLTLLLRAKNMPELPEVDWGNLHGLTFSQLVMLSDGHDRIENLLNSLVTSSAVSTHATVDKRSRSSTKVNDFADQLSKRCYLYFSPGSRYSHMGLRRGEEALSYPQSSSTRLSLAMQASDDFRQAARYWNSARLLTGSVNNEAVVVSINSAMQHRLKKSSYDIARQALEYGSPLALAIKVLLHLEDVAAIVDVCLITASNFRTTTSLSLVPTKKRYTSPINVVKEVDSLGTDDSIFELPWEQSLYHKKRSLWDDKNEIQTTTVQNVGGVTISSLPGAEVTAEDVIDTCYALVFQCIAVLLDSKSHLADRMVSVCADATSDETFLGAFYAFLLDNDYADTLLRIDSQQLDEWLQQRNDLDLLLRYYNIQGRFVEAGQVSLQLACNDIDNVVGAGTTKLHLTLEQRMFYLQMSLISYQKALEMSRKSRVMDDGDSMRLMQTVSEVEDTLQIARFQDRIRQCIASDTTLRSKINSNEHEQLDCSLVDITSLYNDYAVRLELYDECLLILHACRKNDPGTVEQIWLMIFTDVLLPCATRNESAREILQDFFKNEYNDSIILIGQNDPLNGIQLFDSGEWEIAFVNRMKGLGRELFSIDSYVNYAFPVEFLLKKLIDLREAIPTILAPSWGLIILADIGVPYMDLLSVYDSIMSQSLLRIGLTSSSQSLSTSTTTTLTVHTATNVNSNTDTSRHLSYIQAEVDFIVSWIGAAQIDSTSTGSGGIIGINGSYSATVANTTTTTTSTTTTMLGAKKQLIHAKWNGTLLKRLDSIKSQLRSMPRDVSISTLLNIVQSINDDIRYIN